MSTWTKRTDLDPSPASSYSDIWDSDGWQINRTHQGVYLLIDALMPMIPCSSVMGHFATFTEAVARSEELGKPDWSDWQE